MVSGFLFLIPNCGTTNIVSQFGTTPLKFLLSLGANEGKHGVSRFT